MTPVRRRLRRAVALVAALFWGVFFFGAVDLVTSVRPDPEFERAYLLEAGWGVLHLLLVAVPLVALAVRPTPTGPELQVAVVGASVAMAAVLTRTWAQLWPAAGLLLTAAVLMALGGRDDRPVRIDTPGLVVAALGAVPMLALTVTTAAGIRAGRSPDDDITVGLPHWPMQVALWLALPSAAVLASFRRPGRRVSVWTVALGTTWVAGLSVVHPQLSGSLGRVGGLAAILWAVTYLATSEWPWRGRRRRAT